MKLFSEKVKIGNNFKVDADGIMLVKAVILKEGVFDYLESEFVDGGSNQKIVPVYIPLKEFTPEALKSGEGRDVIVGDHDWRTVENALKDGNTVGNISGTLSLQDGKIVCELLIKDKETIDKIIAKELVEISAGYTADFQQEDGSYNGTPYNYRQGNIVFNHVLLLPVGEGRCGSDVRVINKKKGETKMSKTLRVQIGNTDKSVEFSNEDDAAKAETLVEEVQTASAKDVENALEELKTLKEEVETKNAEIEEKTKLIEEYKAKLEEALSPEVQEEMAEELAEQKIAEEEVIDTEFEEDEKEEVKNECKALNRKDRILLLASKVMNKKGFDCANLSEDRMIGAFQAIALEAHQKVQNKKAAEKKFVPGVQAMNKQATQKTGVARMFYGIKK